MRAIPIFPAVMGAGMGVMMPFMLHAVGAEGALWFVLAHLAVAALALLVLGTGLARLWPGLARRLRAHRPDRTHLAAMLGGLVLGFAALHLVAEIGGLH